MKWNLFGWQGLSFPVPEDWNLSKITGDARSGSVRLDDGEIVRVEAEWRDTEGRAPGVTALVDRYVEGLTKKAAKAGRRLEVRRRVRLLPEGSLPDKEWEIFSWRAEGRVYNLAWRCRTCGRIGLVRVFARGSEDIGRYAGQVFGGLEDHPVDGRQLWGVYGMVVRVSEGFRLEEHNLRTGHIRLVFREGNRELAVERVGLADIMLRGRTLKEWFLGFFDKVLRDFEAPSFEGTSFLGHPGVRVFAPPKKLWKRPLFPTLNRVRRSRFLRGCVWHCADMNTIWAITTTSRDQEDLFVEEVVQNVSCHQGQAHQPGGDAQVPSDS
ncbi:MAG TPA: hypothetical protein EYP17_08295 [Candidatus Latescibacteria bacterium]|nr:hypothetical protein [Candidatus Latescibacterota bacterium]